MWFVGYHWGHGSLVLLDFLGCLECSGPRWAVLEEGSKALEDVSKEGLGGLTGSFRVHYGPLPLRGRDSSMLGCVPYSGPFCKSVAPSTSGVFHTVAISLCASCVSCFCLKM